ncbi:MAG: dihydrodipicolinate synthase family protein [Planctomycetota bacterium]
MARTLKGVLPILQTPFTADDRIDLPVLKAEIDWAYSLGADGIGTGMVSETYRLTQSERLELTERLAEFSGGRGAVFASVSAESSRQAVEYAIAAAQAGCDAVMAVPPMTTRLGPAALEGYFKAIADAIPIPLIVQDASGYTGQPVSLELCRRLLETYGPEKMLFKPEASPIGPNLSALRDATAGQARIFEGSGGILLIDSYRRGIAGTMPGMDLLDGIIALWNALQRGDDATAYQLWFPICGLVTLQLQAGLDGFLAIEKYLLVHRGLFASARRRNPNSWEADPETLAEVDRLYVLLQEAVNT